jgi:hypothetical protein
MGAGDAIEAVVLFHKNLANGLGHPTVNAA